MKQPKTLIALNVEVGNLPDKKIKKFLKKIVKQIGLKKLEKECNVCFLIFPTRLGCGSSATIIK